MIYELLLFHRHWSMYYIVLFPLHNVGICHVSISRCVTFDIYISIFYFIILWSIYYIALLPLYVDVCHGSNSTIVDILHILLYISNVCLLIIPTHCRSLLWVYQCLREELYKRNSNGRSICMTSTGTELLQRSA